MLDLHRNAHHADELHRVAELLLPLNLRRSRASLRRRLVGGAEVVSAVLHGALETASRDAQSVGVGVGDRERRGGDFGVEERRRRRCECDCSFYRHCWLSLSLSLRANLDSEFIFRKALSQRILRESVSVGLGASCCWAGLT